MSESLFAASHPYGGRGTTLQDRVLDTHIPGKRVCPTCRGTGINPVWPTKVCPKCNGERRIAV